MLPGQVSECLVECVPPAEYWSITLGTPRPSFKFLPNKLGLSLELCRRQVALLVLRIEIEHVKRLGFRFPVIDQADTASFSPTRCRPTEFPQSCATPQNRSLCRAEQKRQLKRTIRFII